VLVRTILKVLVVDAILLAAEFWVFQDLQWRTGFASSLHNACSHLCTYSPSFSYGILIQFFTMTGNGVHLTSPPTFDWAQALAYAVVILNAWFAYRFFQSRKSRALTAARPS